MSQTYTVKEVADILGYSTNSIYTFLKENRLVGVRVGKGRYRIPQEEVNRLLHLKETTVPIPTTATDFQPFTPQTNIISLDKHLKKTRSAGPSLFDWFVSIIAVITGIGLALPITNFSFFTGFPSIFTLIETSLIITGLSLFAGFMARKPKTDWYLIASLVLGITFFGLSLVLITNKDLHGAIIYILLTLVIFIQLIFYNEDIHIFALYLGLLIIILPCFLVLYPGYVKIIDFSLMTNLSKIQIIVYWVLISSFFTGYFYFTINKKTRFFFLIYGIIALGLVGLAYFYSQYLYWLRSIHLIILASFSFLIPLWDDINLNKKDGKKTELNIFVYIFFISIVTVVFVWLNHKNIVNYSKEELINELTYGRHMIEDTVQSSEEELKNLAKSSLLIEAINEKSVGNIGQLNKDLFINSKKFRRVLTADQNGDILSLYPETETYKNISFRDYFNQTKLNKTSVISSLFETENNGEKRQEIVVTAPILDKNEFVGVLIGSLDLDIIGARLQELSNNKFVEVIDSNGNVVIKSAGLVFLTSLDTEAAREEVFKKGQEGLYGIEESYENGDHFIAAYDYMPKTDWTVILKLPYSDIYSQSSSLLITLVLLGTNITIILINMIREKTEEG